jgi:hypothetical protein
MPFAVVQNEPPNPTHVHFRWCRSQFLIAQNLDFPPPRFQCFLRLIWQDPSQIARTPQVGKLFLSLDAGESYNIATRRVIRHHRAE